jgi:hypothetical protein
MGKLLDVYNKMKEDGMIVRIPEFAYLEKETSPLMNNLSTSIKQAGDSLRGLGGDVMKAYSNEHGIIVTNGDTRYNVPKAAPKVSPELVEKTIRETEIYRRARLAIMKRQDASPEAKMDMLQAQRKQVAYGIDKYPEPLNADTWSSVETINHIMDESIDKLHYLIMLNIKLEQEMFNMSHKEVYNVRVMNERIDAIVRMIDSSIDELNYLVKLRAKIEAKDIRETEACNSTAGLNTDGDMFTDARAEVKHSMIHPVKLSDPYNHFSPDEIDEILKEKE